MSMNRLLLAALLAAAPVVANANKFDGDTSKLASLMSEAEVEQRLGPPVRMDMVGPDIKKWHYQHAPSRDQLDIYFVCPTGSPPWLVHSWKVH
jgi:hypothetical protein